MAEATRKEKITALLGKTDGIMTFVEADRAMLEGATDEQFARFETAAGTKRENPAPAVQTPATPAVVEPTVAAATATAAPKQPTFDELLATASPETREMVTEGIRVAKDRKAATIQALKGTKRCDYTDTELGAMTQTQLDKAIRLAGVEQPRAAAAVDYGVNGTPRTDGDAPKGVPDAPDFNVAIKAANAKSTDKK